MRKPEQSSVPRNSAWSKGPPSPMTPSHSQSPAPTTPAFSHSRRPSTLSGVNIKDGTQASTPKISIPNIVVYGESGCGKSSIINMLANKELADTSSGTESCTFENDGYVIDIEGVGDMKLWDTAGLDDEYKEENSDGQINIEAISQLYKLLHSLSNPGISLLVFVVRGNRFKNNTPRNWRLFHDIICQGKVPSVIVVTNLEAEEDMNRWWLDNRGKFEVCGIRPNSYACITAVKGKKRRDGTHVYDEEYEHSRKRVMHLIHSTYLEREGFSAPPVEWFSDITTTTFKSRLCWYPEEIREIKTVPSKAQETLKKCGFSKEEMEQIMERLT